MDFIRILLVIRIILQAWTVPIKADPFFLKKIQFWKVKKDHEEEMLPLQKIQNQNLPRKLQNLYKVDYKIQDTVVSIK